MDEQLKLLSRRKTTALTNRSLDFALIDAEARCKGINLFKGLSIPDNHYLIPDLHRWDNHLAFNQKITKIKVKLGSNLKKEEIFFWKNWSNIYPIDY